MNGSELTEGLLIENIGTAFDNGFLAGAKEALLKGYAIGVVKGQPVKIEKNGTGTVITPVQEGE